MDYYILQNWMDNCWYVGEGWKKTYHMENAKVFSQQEKDEFRPLTRGEEWHKLPKIERKA